MKRKELEDLGLEKETIDKVMELNGNAINGVKSELDTLQGQYNTLKASHDELEKVDVQALNDKIATLESDYENLKGDKDSVLLDTLKSHALEKLKLTSGATNVDLYSLVLEKELKEVDFDNETKSFVGIEDITNSIKENYKELFYSQEKKPDMVTLPIGKEPIKKEISLEEDMAQKMGLKV